MEKRKLILRQYKNIYQQQYIMDWWYIWSVIWALVPPLAFQKIPFQTIHPDPDYIITESDATEWNLLDENLRKWRQLQRLQHLQRLQRLSPYIVDDDHDHDDGVMTQRKNKAWFDKMWREGGEL
jgi:hypothetical protein